MEEMFEKYSYWETRKVKQTQYMATISWFVQLRNTLVIQNCFNQLDCLWKQNTVIKLVETDDWRNRNVPHWTLNCTRWKRTVGWVTAHSPVRDIPWESQSHGKFVRFFAILSLFWCCEQKHLLRATTSFMQQRHWEPVQVVVSPHPLEYAFNQCNSWPDLGACLSIIIRHARFGFSL